MPMPRSSASSWASIASPWAMSAARLSAISTNAGSGLLGTGVVTAWGTFGGAMAAAARLPAPTKLPTAATARKRRRDGSTGGNIIGWSIADVFVGGVIYTRVAWVIGCASFMAR